MNSTNWLIELYFDERNYKTTTYKKEQTFNKWWDKRQAKFDYLNNYYEKHGYSGRYKMLGFNPEGECVKEFPKK